MLNNGTGEELSLGTLGEDELALLQGVRDLAKEDSKKESAEEQEKEKKPEFSTDELLAIFDSMLTQGEYTEMRELNKKLRVVWRTRTTGEANNITKIIDSAGFNTFMAAQNHSNVLNMTYSLVAFNGKDMRGMKPNDRKAFLESLPEPIIVMLAGSLSKFDYKVAKATEVGQANF